MTHLFTIIFYQPLLNLLVFLYNTISFQDFGLVVILLTIIIKAVLWPLGRKSIKSQKELADIQPELDALKKKYQDNKAELGKATMELYKKHNINPFSSCLPLLIQLPFLFAVYRVFRDGANSNLDLVYSFINKPEVINTVSLGLVDLSKPNIYLAVLAGVAQFWQAKMMLAKKSKEEKKDEDSMASIMNKQMVYFMPLITIFIGARLPGGLTLYWFLVTLITAFQQLIVFKEKKKNKPIEGEIIRE